MTKMLNLYAGLGGNRLKIKGCQVTAVEKDERIAEVYARYNPDDEIVIGDAHQYLLDHYQEFDFIWSSPPCQSHSRMIRSGQNRKPRYPDMKLYEEILFLKHNFSGPWLVENVIPYYDALMPALKMGRHLLWSNFYIPESGIEEKNIMESDMQSLKDWLGIHFDENIYYEGNHDPMQVLRNCVHPDMGLHIFNAGIGATNEQSDLFA